MRFGLNTFLYASPFTNESVSMFKKLKKWGFDTVEIPVEDPSHIDAAKVGEAAKKAGIAVGSICACMGPDRDLRGTPRQQRTGLDYLLKLLDQMVVLGCPSLIGPVYSAVGRADANAKQFELVAKEDDRGFGIRSAPFLDHAFKTTEYRIAITINSDGTWSYEQDTVLMIQAHKKHFADGHAARSDHTNERRH